MDETFEKLEVWKRSHALSIEVYRLLKQCRDWGFKDQITRAANSIADNIAEGMERPGKAEYRMFIGYARGSAGETRSQVLRAKALSYIPEVEADRLIADLIKISRMLWGLYKSMNPSKNPNPNPNPNLNPNPNPNLNPNPNPNPNP